MSNTDLHRLLKRQLKKSQCGFDSVPDIENYLNFIQRVNDSYIAADADRYTLEHSMKVLSGEMQSLYQEQKSLYENRQNDILLALPDVLFLMDEDGRYIDILTGKNTQLYKPRNEMIGELVTDLLPDKQAEIILNAVRQSLKSDKLSTIEYSHDTPGGNIHFEARVTPSNNRHNNKRTVIFLAMDITEKKNAIKKDQLLSKILSSASEGILIMDSEKNIISANPAYFKITGTNENTIIGKVPAFSYDDDLKNKLIWEHVEQTNHWTGEIHGIKNLDIIFPIWLSIEKIFDPEENSSNYIAILTDVSEIKQSREQLEHIATHDSLTQLPNRALFNDRLLHAISRANRDSTGIALFFLDLDRFKIINDNLGHTTGDQLLQEVAKRLLKSCREEDSLARLGGDEFTVIAEKVRSRDDAKIVANSIIKSFSKPFSLGEYNIDISASIGISIYPDDATDIDQLIKHSDSAMYQAKNIDLNSFEFYEKEHAQSSYEFFSIEQGLQKALTHNELFLLYQPQFNISTNRMTGVEALVRWQNPEKGLIGPNEFIPVAENTGLIIPMGEWIIETAFKQFKLWQKENLTDFSLSINLSRRQLTSRNLTDKIKALLERYNIHGENIEFEITESSIIDNEQIAYNNLLELHNMGIKLAIDDFGTGHSSLTNLKRFPLDRLKIDQSFVREVTKNPNDEAIINATIALARSFDLKIIAEGVETVEQRDLLLSCGCEEVQGFLYSRPVTATEISTLATDNT